MRRLMLAAMLGLGMLSGAASAAPGPAAAESGLMMPVQYQRHYAPPRAYGRRYYAPPRRYAPPPRRHYRHYAPPRGRYLPPPRPYYGR